MDYMDFIRTNKQRIIDNARMKTRYDPQGQPTISRVDDDFDEAVWDEHYKKMENVHA